MILCWTGKRLSQPFLLSVYNRRRDYKRTASHVPKPIVAVYMLRPMTPPAPDVASIASSVFLEFLVSYQFLFMGEIVHSTEPTQYPSSYLPSPEQGRRNDLSRDAAVRKNSSSVVAMSNNIRPTDIHHLSPPVPFISDSVHCSPLTQFSGSNRRSCHTDEKLSVDLDDDVTSGVVRLSQSSPPSWAHYFSKSSSPSSLSTQIAAGAHLDYPSPRPTDTHHLSPPVTFISDSVHCSPLNQFSAGSNGRSCHTDEKLSVGFDDVTSCVVPVVPLSQSSPPSWAHDFSKSSSPSSLSTHFAAGAHLDATSPRPTDIHHLSPPVPFISDSVHCSPLNQFSAGSNGRSCHTDVKLSVELDNVTSGVVPTRQSSAPSWVHVFSKSSSPSSLRTQIAAAAHLDATSPKVFHRRFRRAKRKRKKTKGLLEEVFLPANLFTLSSELIDREIIVFDGGNPHTPPIKPPYGVHWQSLCVRRLHIQDNIEPNIGLTAPRMGYDISPFIRLPRQMSLDIIGEMGLQQIVESLLACETLRRTTLLRGDHKRVFTDYGKPVRYTCVGPQPSRNSKLVRPHPPFMQSLPECHWESLLWLMKRAEICFRTIADSRVISHLDHAKKLVNYQTGFHPVRDTILRSCVKNYFFECLTSILDKLSYRRDHTLVYEKSQSSIFSPIVDGFNCLLPRV